MMRSKTTGPGASRKRQSVGATRSRQTHEAILDAAMQVLEEHGYAGFTIEAVALRARAGKPTIYRWWKSKGALLVELQERLSAPLGELPELGSVDREIEQFLKLAWSLMRRFPHTGRGILADAQQDAVTAGLMRERLHARRHATLDAILRRGIARGELPADCDVDVAIDFLLGQNILHLLLGGAPGDAAAHRVVHVLLHGLRGPPPASVGTGGS